MLDDFSEEVIEYIQKIKELEKKILELIESAPSDSDKRWQAIGKTKIQEARMALVRSVTEK